MYNRIMNSIKKWEIWGAVVSIFLGSLLHFVFEWSGGSHFVALFGAVNESTWEHLKIAFWPTFIFAVIEWFVYGKEIKNFCLAIFVKLFSIPVIIIILFYGWLAIFPDNFIWDISIFVVAIIIGYLMSYKIMISKIIYGLNKLWIILITLLILFFSLYSYYPPKIFLFHDPVKNDYGIE